MLQFSKYQGLGNDFLIVEGRQGQLPDAISNPDPAWAVSYTHLTLPTKA